MSVWTLNFQNKSSARINVRYRSFKFNYLLNIDMIQEYNSKNNQYLEDNTRLSCPNSNIAKKDIIDIIDCGFPWTTRQG